MHESQQAYQSLFTTNMGFASGERIVIFSDIIRDDEEVTPQDQDRRTRLLSTANDMADFCTQHYGNTTFVAFPATPASGAEPPIEAWRAVYGEQVVEQLQTADLLKKLLEKTVTSQELAAAKAIVLAQSTEVCDIVIALANNSTSHTNFRKLACAAKTRFASLPHFDPTMFQTSMCVDWLALAERTERLVVALNQGSWVHISAPNGTDMHICKEGRRAEGDDGLLTKSGSFGNLPAGEAYLAPLEGKSYGTMVIEWGPTAKLSAPLHLTVKKGSVDTITGVDPLRQRLEALFERNSACRNLAELGIGTNDRASRPDNVLEAEKILGTIHLALGDNMGFGGTVAAPFHEDYVIYEPTVIVEQADGAKTVILQSGRLLV